MFANILQKFYSLFSKNRSNTVHKAFPVAFFAALLLSAASVITQEESYITIDMSTASVNQDETFFMDVSATAHVAVNAVDIVIEYPESRIKITGIDTGGSVLTLWAVDPYAKNGKIYLRGGLLGRGFIGQHDIARIRAVAIESGTAYINTDSVRLIAADGEGNDVSIGEDGTDQTRLYIRNTDGSLVGTASVEIVTDLDGDGDVDLSDISAFMASWFDRTIVFDFNNDGRMNFRDFSILLADSFFK